MRLRRNAWLEWSLVAALLFGGRVVHGQSFTLTLTPSVSSANIIPAPTSAVYATGTSASTPSWTIVATCQGKDDQCPVTISSSSGTLALVRVTMSTATGAGCTGSAATYSLQSSPIELFRIAGGNGNSCTATLTFAVTGLTLTSYQSSSSAAASTFARSVQFSINCTKANGNKC